jgi:hypothetical protein
MCSTFTKEADAGGPLKSLYLHLQCYFEMDSLLLKNNSWCFPLNPPNNLTIIFEKST